MTINFRQLKKLPVITESGQLLGKICDVMIETNTSGIVNYEVKKFLGGQALLIDPADIRSIEADKVVVRDAAIKAEIKEEQAQTEKDLNPSPAIEKSLE
ncbi:TPA: hypothetical protein DF272_06865 [Candidatus Falkowbacteria bacterium]|nr:hypothetical protein [Candidatus Falkowbacteria bacterium]